jgi:hypothetical protein
VAAAADVYDCGQEKVPYMVQMCLM